MLEYIATLAEVMASQTWVGRKRRTEKTAFKVDAKYLLRFAKFSLVTMDRSC